MSLCNCNQGRLPCTCKTDYLDSCEAAHLLMTPSAPLPVVIKRSFIAPSDFGASNPEVNVSGYQDLYASTAAQILATAAPDPVFITSLNSAPVRKLAERIAIAVAGDEQLGGGCDLSAGMFGTRLSALVVELAAQEADLYAAQDQVAGLQELMSAQGPQPMDTAPTDGTRVLIHTEVYHYSADRYGVCDWRKIGTQWLEARFTDSKWVEWCGNEKTSSTNTLNPIEWAPRPEVTPCLSN